VVDIRAGIFYDVLSILVKDRDNGLFSRGASGCSLYFSSFAGWFRKQHIVDFNNFFV